MKTYKLGALFYGTKKKKKKKNSSVIGFFDLCDTSSSVGQMSKGISIVYTNQ